MRPLLAFLLLSLVGCGSTYVIPYSSGQQAYGDTFGKGGYYPTDRYVVWANHPDAEAEITRILLQIHHVVVERAQVERVFAEQRFSLLHASDADVMRVGQLIGATDIIFADVTIEQPGYLDKGQRPTVRVRGVRIQTGQIRWSGMASFPALIATAGPVIGPLTQLAILRAICRNEDWNEEAIRQPGHPPCNKNHPYYYVTAPEMH